VRDFNLVFMLQSAFLKTFNLLWDAALNSESKFLSLDGFDMGHTFTLTKLLHFLLKSSHEFYPENGLTELLEKLEFSKGTEQAKSLGLRIQFINHLETSSSLIADATKPFASKSTASLIGDQYRSSTAIDFAKRYAASSGG
jgi:hypothetical protein